MNKQLKQDIKDWEIDNISDKTLLYSLINNNGLNKETEQFLNKVLQE
jgi:hypothetical protein